MPHDDTLLGKKTKESSASYVSSMDIDKETNLGPVQVASFARKGIKDDLSGQPIGDKLLEPTLMMGSDPLTRSVPLKELSSFGEDISLLQSIFSVKLERGESSKLSILFKSGMFDNYGA